MTEFEQCMLKTLKDITSKLSDISGGLQYISNHLATLNTNHDNDWTYNIHTDLEKISDSLARIYTIQDERL
jgi:hypothetical protein